MSRGIITIAYGSERYWNMGKALLRSMRHHGYEGEIAIVTDLCDKGFWEDGNYIVPIDLDKGSGVRQKLWLDCYSPFEETLFIDSDCLLYANADELWERYRTKRGFGVYIDGYKTQRDRIWAASNEKQIFEFFKIDKLADFNGGVYWWTRSGGEEIFRTARGIAEKREVIGFRPFKNSDLNDELAISISMSVCGCAGIEGESVMGCAGGNTRGLWSTDVLLGRSRFQKNGKEIQPVLIHFNFESQDYITYVREMCRLTNKNNSWRHMLVVCIIHRWLPTHGEPWVKARLRKYRIGQGVVMFGVVLKSIGRRVLTLIKK